jgi:peptide deformylase
MTEEKKTQEESSELATVDEVDHSGLDSLILQGMGVPDTQGDIKTVRVHEILTVPDLALYEKCRYVDDFTGLKNLGEEMVATMITHSGIGLSANQIGRLGRYFVLRARLDDEARMVIDPEYDGGIMCINPVIEDHLRHQKRIRVREGCLSIPNVTKVKKRYPAILAKWLTPEGRQVRYHMAGMAAVVFQHEMDHLDGKLITTGT